MPLTIITTNTTGTIYFNPIEKHLAKSLFVIISLPFNFKHQAEIKHKIKAFTGSIMFDVKKSKRSNKLLPNIFKFLNTISTFECENIIIYSDSLYSINILCGKNKPKLNIELIKNTLNEIKKFRTNTNNQIKIFFKHINAHIKQSNTHFTQFNEYNNFVDKLASDACLK